MIRKNRRELNSYSPSKYLVCRKISKKLVRYYVHKLFFVDGGRAQIGKCTELGKTLTMSMLDWFFSAEKEGESRNLFQGLYQVSGFTRCCWSFWRYIKVSAWVRTASMSSIGVSAVV